MAIDKNTIKNWFLTGLKPTQAQFWATWDSFWHKDEKIPITAIEDIENILNAKADAEALANHFTDANAHGDLFSEKANSWDLEDHKNAPDAHFTLFAQAKIVKPDELLIFKVSGNINNALLENGDYCMGFVEGQFINANYNGGDPTELSSFEM